MIRSVTELLAVYMRGGDRASAFLKAEFNLAALKGAL